MLERNELLACQVCGDIIEVLHVGAGELMCCGESMKVLEPKTEDEGKEKHVPVIEKTDSGVKVKVSSVPHPMEKTHFIEWIELIADGLVYRKFLEPGDPPEVEFSINADTIKAREHCNIHGLWQAI